MQASRHARESSLLFPKSNSIQKPGPKTSMGPPPLQLSARHTNANLHRTWKDFSPLPLQEMAHRANNHIQRPQKEFTPLNELGSGKRVSHNGSKLSETQVSITSILKRNRGFESAPERGESAGKELVPKYKRRKVEIENPLYEEYKDCIEVSHETLKKEGRTALNEAFEDLIAYIKGLNLDEGQQIETIKGQLSAMFAPADKIKASGGQTIDVAAEIQAFKELLEAEGKGFEEKWDDWEKLQEEIAMLGVQVLGDQAGNMVPEALFRRLQCGYKSDTEKWAQELEEELKGPMEEIKAAGEEALKKLAAAEKECDSKFNQQKAKIVAAITMDDC